MTKLLAIAVLLSVGSASAETTPPAPAQAPNPPMVRNSAQAGWVTATA